MADVPGLTPDAGGFDWGVVAGRATGSPAGPCRVPYQGRSLEGASLRRQLEHWRRRGIIERDAADALGNLADAPGVDLAGQTFACVGASSEMGPFDALMAHGATVLAVDVPSAGTWRRLVQ